MKAHFVIGLFASLVLSSAHAQKEDVSHKGPQLNEGQMFVVKFTPASKTVEVRLAGAPSAILGPDRIEVFGREIRSGKTQTLTVKPVGQAFEIVEKLDSQTPVEIDIRDKSNQKKETFKFELNKKP